MGLVDELRAERGGWLARLGLAVAVAALATSAVLQAVDGIALKPMVEAWATATVDQKDAAFRAAAAVRQIETGAAAYSAMLSGIAVALIAAGLTVSAAYPRWLGGLGVFAGLATFAGGLAMTFGGFSATAMAIGMPANLALAGFLVVTSGLMWRRGAPQPNTGSRDE